MAPKTIARALKAERIKLRSVRFTLKACHRVGTLARRRHNLAHSLQQFQHSAMDRLTLPKVELPAYKPVWRA